MLRSAPSLSLQQAPSQIDLSAAGLTAHSCALARRAEVTETVAPVRGRTNDASYSNECRSETIHETYHGWETDWTFGDRCWGGGRREGRRTTCRKPMYVFDSKKRTSRGVATSTVFGRAPQEIVGHTGLGYRTPVTSAIYKLGDV